MNLTGKYELCKHKGCEDCFARSKAGRCTILHNTLFKHTFCPFYKTKNEFEESKKHAHELLEKRGALRLELKYKRRQDC